MADPPARRADDSEPTATEIVEKVRPFLRPERTAEAETLLMELYHQGPLPPPEQLAGYDSVLPGLAERITSMAEQNLTHRQTLEAEYVRGDILLKTRGQLFAICALLAMLMVVCFAIYIGQPWVAGVLGGGTIVAVVSLFLTQSEKPETEPRGRPTSNAGTPSKKGTRSRANKRKR